MPRYDDEIKMVDKALDYLKKDIEKYPENVWNHITYLLLKYSQDELKKERDELITSLYYEGIDENYTEQLEKDDELAIARAKTELDLITKILKEVDKI